MKFSNLIQRFFLLVIAGVILGTSMGVISNLFKFKGWQIIKTTQAPPAMSFSSVAYNNKDNYAILFGGTSPILVDSAWKFTWSSDTWKWDGNTWEQLASKAIPAAREKHTMAYDENRNVIVLFGGTGDSKLFDDTWEWNGEEWKEIKPKHVPSPRCCHTMAYDAARKGVILYGGWNSINGTFVGDTWLWDGKDWTQLPYQSPQMSGHALVSYPPGNSLISIQTANMGTWELSESGWSDLSIQSPPSRSDGRADYGDGNIVLFGGSQDTKPMNDTWLFNGTNWFQFQLPSVPSARYGHILFYDAQRESFIVFGGTTTNETWELKLPDDLSSITIHQKP